MKKTVFVFSALIVSLLALFQLSKYTLISGNGYTEYIIAVIAVVFLALGFYLNKKNVRRENSLTLPIDSDKIKELGISQREYQVLLEISNGLSNKEIGEKLFVSESTVKTHVSNLLMKLEAKRRTQAVKRAKKLNIIAE